LPGIIGIVACALWARSRPAVAAFAGAGVLVVSSGFIRITDTAPYSTVLINLSLAEVIAGFELVFYCVRRVKPGVAFAAVTSLVVASLIAVTGRSDHFELRTGSFFRSLSFGLVLLGAAILIGLNNRRPQSNPQGRAYQQLLREQWPLIGVLSLPLFLELVATFTSAAYAFPLLFCSAGAATAAIISARRPQAAAVILSALIFVSALATPLVDSRISGYPLLGGVPLTQIVAGMATVAYLVRSLSRARAWANIGLLTMAVAVAAVLNADPSDEGHLLSLSRLEMPFIAAVLLLGISVATGMYLKSRASEQAQIMQSAVTDAQTTERMALARELHDVVAHHVTGIVVQAQAAKMMGDKDPKIAMAALERIETAGTEALVAMRRLVRSMRGDAPAGSTDFSEQATTDLAADLRRLVEGANHGVPTELHLELTRQVPPEVARSALRLVQESLTNVGKHASTAPKATVLAQTSASELRIEVTNEAPTPRDTADNAVRRVGSGGYGLIGMRERVELLHGRLTAGPLSEGGWRVQAWLPLEGTPLEGTLREGTE
jgi:signal transduction histidine kinase